MRRRALLSAVALTGLLAAAAGPATAQETPVCGFTVIETFPHDDQAYTQGLLIRDGELFEGTGLFDGRSSIRRVDLATGAVLQIRNLADQYFGEGITLVGDRLIQLTWQSEVAFIWDRTTFDPAGSFSYTGSGWGLTDGAGQLIMSNGSSTLLFRDPATFAVLREVVVRDRLVPVNELNEMEFNRGEVLANVYGDDRIARIRPDTGRVIAWIDLTPLRSTVPDSAGVLNGIAFDEATDRLFVTGKLWPTLFEIEVADCPPLALFADDFASGTTGGWTSSVGD